MRKRIVSWLAYQCNEGYLDYNFVRNIMIQITIPIHHVLSIITCVSILPDEPLSTEVIFCTKYDTQAVVLTQINYISGISSVQ